MLNLKILIGSTRPGRAADRVIPWITGAAREHDDFTVEVLDLRDWPLPMFGETFATWRAGCAAATSTPPRPGLAGSPARCSPSPYSCTR
jgi:NAD(P)H-dependent FMN reductase